MDREERAALVERLRTLVRIPTVSTREPAELGTATFDEFIVVLYDNKGLKVAQLRFYEQPTNVNQ